jgi:hypothetical protein
MSFLADEFIGPFPEPPALVFGDDYFAFSTVEPLILDRFRKEAEPIT